MIIVQWDGSGPVGVREEITRAYNCDFLYRRTLTCGHSVSRMTHWNLWFMQITYIEAVKQISIGERKLGGDNETDNVV